MTLSLKCLHCTLVDAPINQLNFHSSLLLGLGCFVLGKCNVLPLGLNLEVFAAICSITILQSSSVTTLGLLAPFHTAVALLIHRLLSPVD
ncbi:hypothetical protein GDO78_015409 [Eleutherodactylus coqui]|uniref:Uncharacterized protein n=1 Tax=Eleutherodactylus coqui TaxID=57060 RepID=A0A8J6JJV9_ELECQ|nr:hypothetical protein GDO78_015409 [Eleutherodactylus coqui]